MKNHWVNFNQTWHKAFFGEGDLRFYKWVPFSYQKGDYLFFPLQINVMKRFKLVSQVSDVAHGPLVRSKSTCRICYAENVGQVAVCHFFCSFQLMWGLVIGCLSSVTLCIRSSRKGCQ